MHVELIDCCHFQSLTISTTSVDYNRRVRDGFEGQRRVSLGLRPVCVAAVEVVMQLYGIYPEPH